MGNSLRREVQVDILARVCAGRTMRSIERDTGIMQKTVSRFLVTLGHGIERIPCTACALSPSEPVSTFAYHAEKRAAGIAWSLVTPVHAPSGMALPTCIGENRSAALGAVHAVAREHCLELRWGVDAPPAPLPLNRIGCEFRRADVFRACVAVIAAEYNFCRADTDLTTPASRGGAAKRPWSIGELVTTLLGGVPPSIDEAERERHAGIDASERDLLRRLQLAATDGLPVFGRMVPIGELAALADKRPTEIMHRMRLGYDPEEAAFGK